MPERKPLTVDQVVVAIERELGRAPELAPPPPAAAGRARELQRRFRAQPLGGKGVLVKSLVHWFVASAFDRQAKVVEALLDEIEAEAARSDRLESRLATVEARLAALESSSADAT